MQSPTDIQASPGVKRAIRVFLLMKGFIDIFIIVVGLYIFTCFLANAISNDSFHGYIYAAFTVFITIKLRTANKEALVVEVSVFEECEKRTQV
jgi:hypothetical protein